LFGGTYISNIDNDLIVKFNENYDKNISQKQLIDQFYMKGIDKQKINNTVREQTMLLDWNLTRTTIYDRIMLFIHKELVVQNTDELLQLLNKFGTDVHNQ